MDNRVDCRGHLGAKCDERDVDSAQERARLDAAQAVFGRVCVNGGHGTGVAGVERLQEIERFAAAYFTDDEAIRPQAQRGMYEIPDRHLALSVLVRLARLE